MLHLQKAVGPKQPNLPADVRLVEEWLNWWVVALNRLPFLRLEDGVRWFQEEVTGEPFATGIVEPGSDTESNLQQRPKLPPAAFPRRPPVGPALSPSIEPGTPLALPPRTGIEELSEDDFATAAKDLGCEVLVIKAVALQEGKGHGFDQYNRPTILYEPLHFLRAQGAGLKRPQKLTYQRKVRAAYPALTKLKPRPHPYGTLAENWQYLQWAYLLSPHEAIRDVSWGEFQILGSNASQAGYGSAELFVNAMCRSLQDQLNAFVQFLISIDAADALAKKDWASFASAYNGLNYAAQHYDTQLEAKYNSLLAASKAGK